jgi:tRNA(Leu) C34 or U34 (ribose-2'-O)-methylase TrmL
VGIPSDILKISTKVFIDMPGVGFCLNTSQAANVFLYEVSKQILNLGLNK